MTPKPLESPDFTYRPVVVIKAVLREVQSERPKDCGTSAFAYCVRPSLAKILNQLIFCCQVLF